MLVLDLENSWLTLTRSNYLVNDLVPCAYAIIKDDFMPEHFGFITGILHYLIIISSSYSYCRVSYGKKKVLWFDRVSTTIS